MWVSVDILWDEFASKLSRRFRRPVYFSYLRAGDSTPINVQCEEDFEELCVYLDDSQVSCTSSCLNLIVFGTP